VLGQNGDAVENPFGGGIRLGEVKSQGVRVNLLEGDRLAANKQKVALRRVNPFVQINAETEEYIVGAQGLAIGEPHAATKLQSITAPVRRKLPGFGKSGLCALRLAVDVNQVGCHAPDDVTGGVINRRHGIKRLGLRTFGDDQCAAVPTDFSVSD
jgi:hypothetical protein